jgi:LysR family transcriptional regulator, low CO2-responsive transcriptional regulator
MSRTAKRRFFRHGLLPQLFVFEAVARLGSVTRAAEELHLAQPTVSIQIKKLAETLEVTLFEPDGRRLRLTAAGHALREICDELMHCLTLADAKLEAFRRPKAEHLRLAAEPQLRAAASALIADFCARHPGVHASLHIGERAELRARLAAGRDELYLFALDIVAHSCGGALGPAAQLFLRESRLLDASAVGANNAPAIEEMNEWSSRGTTTRRLT